MHIAPADAPVANQPTLLQFQFGSSNGPFQISDYKVSVAVQDDTKTIATMTVTEHGSQAQGQAWVLFPRPAVYTISLSGVSIEGTEPDFGMPYQVRVTGSAEVSDDTTRNIILVAGLIIFVMVLIRLQISKQGD